MSSRPPSSEPDSPRFSRREDGSYVLTVITPVNRSLDDTFRFFAEAENLDAITPPWLKFRTLTPLPIEMREGTVIDYALRLHGIPVRWRSRIEDWSPPEGFTDVQLKGPYRSWRHEHRFERVEPMVTAVKDRVLYRVPGGALVHWFVKRDLDRIFRFRQRRVLQLLEAA